MSAVPGNLLQAQVQVQAPISRPFRTSRFGERFGPQLDPALRSEVAAEQLNMVLGHTRLGTLVATAFAVFLALQLRDNPVPASIVDGWLAVKLCVAAARIVISLRYERLGRPGGASWGRATDAWLLADGFVWGMAGFTMMSAPIPLTSLVGSAIVGVSCIATFGLQFSKRSTAAIGTNKAAGRIRRRRMFRMDMR